MFDYIAVAFSRKRRSDDAEPKPSIESVIADNIRATQDLADTITRYDATVTKLCHSAKDATGDCEFDTPTVPQRRATDHW